MYVGLGWPHARAGDAYQQVRFALQGSFYTQQAGKVGIYMAAILYKFSQRYTLKRQRFYQ